ncbi:peroxisomal-coenzyme A synthetase [Wickerhamomyces ciferrii]|uniref:Peroxisomal-coenzyme A synthetase n=1 Tax=Wickerhamomyces ciferrii (strain ATCC 14091 / BCRC 22168 / CBS 111 / JCM 3599 / NBRC 0793 / NRRL Y-1031 F-60-10) TaxID=1206466 RepID=K0KQH7_WICCF|nr:peroxisomal-coenzyme A synthetase [Wickerhamomyces ciferrii]CCH45286.1 peroxisomal-coenzyme A synthetase [Wickerhamomyces ciferrii]
MSTFIDTIHISQKKSIIIPDGPQLTYKELGDITGHLQSLFFNANSPLYELSKPQTSIAISLVNNLELVSSFLAITNASRIAAPLNPNYKKDEFDFYLNDLNAKAVILPKGAHKDTQSAIYQSSKDHDVLLIEVWWENSRRRVEYEVFNHNSSTPLYSSLNSPIYYNNQPLFPGTAKPDDVALILHTSGTTGRPKTVPLTQANLSRSMHNIAQTYKLTSDDKSYIVMPLFHVHGLIGALLSTLHTQGTVIIPPKFSAGKFWNDFIKYGATWYSAVPTIHLILLNTAKPSPLPKIRFIRSCSSALAPTTFHKLEKELNAPVLEAYAMTEASHQMTSNNLPPGKRKPGTVGQGQGVEIVILNDQGDVLPQGQIGEVSIKGTNVTKGYANNDKANAESFTKGYFRTGDQGYLDDEKFLVLTGRIKELINRGGEKISPIELDGVLLSHPKVDEAVAFGVPDEKYGQVVNAAIVLKKGEQLSVDELKQFLGEKIASFKIPSKFYFADSLVKTATGKIQRRKIAEVFASKSKL